MALLFLGANLICVQFRGQFDHEAYKSREYAHSALYGWPIAFVRMEESQLLYVPKTSYGVRVVPLACNAAFCFAILAATAFLLNAMMRRRRLQITLAGLLSSILVVALLLALRSLFFAQAPDLGRAFIPWYLQITLFIALGCTIYTVGWLTFRWGAWYLRLVWRKPREPKLRGAMGENRDNVAL